MCRMVAVVGSSDAAHDTCARFRSAAHDGRVARGAAPGHMDGWGIVFAGDDGRLQYAGRSIADAATDAGYPRALEVLRTARARGVTLAHLRKQTLGAKLLENTHPFVQEGLALAHNGTVFGLAGPGENDTRVLFARLLDERRKGASIEDALVAIARDVEARHRFTSLTLLVTDGASLWGLRRVGNDPVACAPEACATDYYTLGQTTLRDGSVVVSQEHALLGLRDWTPIPDGALIHVAPEGKVSTRQVL